MLSLMSTDYEMVSNRLWNELGQATNWTRMGYGMGSDRLCYGAACVQLDHNCGRSAMRHLCVHICWGQMCDYSKIKSFGMAVKPSVVSSCNGTHWLGSWVCAKRPLSSGFCINNMFELQDTIAFDTIMGLD